MNRTVRSLNLAKKIFFCLFIFPAFFFAQNETRQAAQNSREQQMESKKGNFTSFSAPHDNLSAWAKFNKNKSHPEFGRLPYNASEGYVEVLEKRKVDERFLVNEKNPGEFHIQKAMGPLHYKKDGQWLTIDPRIEDIGNGIFEASKQYDAVGFDVNKSYSYIKTPDGIVTFNNWKLYGTDADGAAQLLASANWSSYTAGEDGIYVNEIFPGIDAQMQVYRGSVKTDFIVKKLNFSSYVNLLFKDEFKSPLSTNLQFFGDASASSHAVSAVYLMNGKSPVLEIGEALAYPQGGTKDQKILPEYFLEGNTLVTSVPVEWIQKHVSRTHVIIDPLVSSSNTLAQGSITGSQYNGSCNFTNSCNQNLSVNTPANATLTDVFWSFTYIAQGACWLEDGALRFATGACLSPSQAGFYWFCQLSQPGTCNSGPMPGISIMTDVSSCLPAPSCAPQAVNFVMQFFRSCWGANNCGNACIGANSPWIMTLEGHTVEFTSPGSEISVSSSTICFGQTVFASSTGTQYGVPAHTINWSFNSSGTPSLGAGAGLTVNFPAPGTYTLYSIVTDGCAQTATASTVITVNPIPTLTVTPSADPICQGQSSTLNASGASTYTWSANAGGGTGSSANVTPGVGTTVYTVTGTASGCSNTGTVSVTVNPNPVITTTASPTSICAGQTATLTAGGATSYTWSANAGSATSSTTTVSPTVTDTYTVTGDALGCTATQTVSIAVTPAPSLTVNANPASICAGQTATLTVSGATTYTWSSGGQTATEIVTPTITTTYTITGDNAGCTANETVTVNVTPLPSLTVTANPASVCPGQTATLTASGAATYTWSANSGGGNGNPITVSPIGNTTYTLAGTQSGCSDSTTITVNMGSPPVLSISATDTTICSGQVTTLTASGATSYTWSPGGTGASINDSPATTTTYTLIGDNSGCSDTINFVINVNPTPTVTAVASPTAICSGQSSTLTAGGATSYTWSANAGSVTTSTATVSPSSTTTYTVTGDSLGCTSTQVVTVNVTATPNVIALAPTPTVCSGQQVPLIAGGATSYTWSANAGSVTTQTAIVTPVSNPETYTVTGANGNCTGSATVSIGVVTQPTVTASPAALSLCAGQSDTLFASVLPAGTSISWSGGVGSNDTVIVTPGASTVYTVTATNGGCSDAQTISVTVNPIPTLAAIASQTVCSGNNVSSINFNASVGATVNWANTNTNIGVAASGTTNIAGYLAPVVTGQETGVITATPTDASTGCTGSSQTFTITINPKPVITGPAIIDSALCGMPTGGISGLTVSNGTPAYTYQWYNGSTPVSGTNTITLSNQPIGTYSLLVTDANMCTATSGPYTINGTPLVVAGFTATPTAGTATLNVSFTNTSVGATTYNWNFANGLSSTGQNPNTVYTGGGMYIVTLTASNGNCTSTATDTIFVEQAIDIDFPNVFSPNGDNINDEFMFVTSGITQLSCDIYNRWGQKVKTLNGPTDKWDGKLSNGNMASEGTYFYTVIATSYDDKVHSKQGSLTIVK